MCEAVVRVDTKLGFREPACTHSFRYATILQCAMGREDSVCFHFRSGLLSEFLRESLKLF